MQIINCSNLNYLNILYRYMTIKLDKQISINLLEYPVYRDIYCFYKV